MAVSASVVDGVLQQTAASNATSEEKKTSNSAVDKESFLQLLVAQMKYQDPLEPTSNTEYISQYATFSELEQMQNMSATMELSRASGLVGQTVVVEAKDANGDAVRDMGVVDYITYENNKALVWVNGNSYKLDAVVEVADPKYVDAYAKASNLVNAIRKLPSTNNLTVDNKEAVESIQSTFDGMDDYQKSFIAQDLQKLIAENTQKMKELLMLSGGDDDKKGEDVSKGE